MNSPGAIRHKLKQVIYRHLKRRLDQELTPAAENCVFNDTVLDPYSLSKDRFPVPLHVCIHAEVEHRVCDPRWGGAEKAKECPYYKAPLDKDEIKEEFKEFMQRAPLPEIAAEYPDVAALMWELGEDAVDRPDSERGGFLSVPVGPHKVLVETLAEAEALKDWQEGVEAETEEIRQAGVRLQGALNESVGKVNRLREELALSETQAQRCHNEMWAAQERAASLEQDRNTDVAVLSEPKRGFRAWAVRLLGGTP